MVILENSDIYTDIYTGFIENIDTDIDKEILQSIDIKKCRINWNLAYRTGLSGVDVCLTLSAAIFISINTPPVGNI